MKSRNDERRELDEIMNDWNLTFNSRVDKILDWHRACVHGEPKWCEHMSYSDDNPRWVLISDGFYVPSCWKHCPECSEPRPEERREHE